MKLYFRHIGTIISQALNVILLNGHPDESISARSYRTETRWAVKLIDKVFGEGHCYRAYLTDVEHARVYHSTLSR